MHVKKHPLKAFLCHASEDKPIVRDLSLRLIAEGWIDIWMDEKDLLPGQDWRLNIEQAVESSDVVIICLSNHSVSKNGFIQKELRFAKAIAQEKPEEEIFLIPLRLDECNVPRGLRVYQWADYFGDKREDAYSRLTESLKTCHDQRLKVEQERILQERGKQELRNTKKVFSKEEFATLRELIDGFSKLIAEPINKYGIFLSYASADRENARLINDFFSFRELSVFLSEKDIEPSLEWEDDIKTVLKNSDSLCILMTPNSLKGGWVMPEWAVAVTNDVYIFTVLDQCAVDDLPKELKVHPIIDFDFRQISKIVEFLKTALIDP